MTGTPEKETSSGHYQDFADHHYEDVAAQDDIEKFLFTSESVGEGHPGRKIS